VPLTLGLYFLYQSNVLLVINIFFKLDNGFVEDVYHINSKKDQ